MTTATKTVWGNITFINIGNSLSVNRKVYCHNCNKRTSQINSKPYWSEMRMVVDCKCKKCGEVQTKKAKI